jgi:hypothetical protein
MILLAGPSEVLQISKGAATTTTDPEAYSVFRVQTQGQSMLSNQRSQITGNGADVDVVSAPSAQTMRIVEYLTVNNRDTVTQTFTVVHDVSGTNRKLAQFTMLTNEWAEYTNDSGWKFFQATGAIKV